MSKEIDCSKCNKPVDLKNHPPLCHVCPIGHVLCENCNAVARDYCLYCGGKTVRKLPDKDIEELFKVSADTFKKKISDSSSLIVPEENIQWNTATKPPPTVIGFKKWPRTFFHKIPDENRTLGYNERQFLQMLPNIIEEDELDATEPLQNTCWESLPKSVADFEMSSKIMKCPITRCGYPICNFDATHHLLQSHENIPIEVLERFGIGNFKMNTLFTRENEIRTLMRILVPGVVTDLGITKYRDCLPLCLLYTRVNALKAEKDNNAEGVKFFELDNSNDNDYLERNPWKNTDCLLLWCAGIVPLDYAFTVSISVYPCDDELMNLGALVKVFSLHMPQNGHAIYRSTERLMITKNDLQRITKPLTTFEGQVRIM